MDVPVLLAEGAASRGGIGRISVWLRDALERAGGRHRLHLVTSRLREKGLVAHLSIPFAMAGFGRRLAHFPKAIVHINVAPRGSTWRKFLFALMTKAAGRKLLLHLHGSGYDEWFAARNPAAKGTVVRFFRMADAVVVLGEHWRRFVIDTLGVDPARVHLIPNGVPLHAGVVPVSAKVDVPTVVSMGVIGERKGTDVLLDALAELHARGVGFRAVLGGNGAIDWARQRAEANGIAPHVDFVGWLDAAAVQSHLRSADLFVLPSRQENQPLSILEAMGCGLPVVATAIGAISEQVVDGETGLLVPPGDVPALTAALERLLLDGSLRTRMGENGRSRFHERFTIEICSGAFARLYDRLAVAKG